MADSLAEAEQPPWVELLAQAESPTAAKLKIKQQKKRKAAAEAPQPTRRSLRQETRRAAAPPKLPAEEYDFGDEEEPEEEEPPKKKSAPRKKKEEDPAALDEHNMNRVRTMTQEQLRTRIKRIGRIDKMVSFIQVLKAVGLGDLADEARERLAEIGG